MLACAGALVDRGNLHSFCIVGVRGRTGPAVAEPRRASRTSHLEVREALLGLEGLVNVHGARRPCRGWMTR